MTTDDQRRGVDCELGKESRQIQSGKDQYYAQVRLNDNDNAITVSPTGN